MSARERQVPAPTLAPAARAAEAQPSGTGRLPGVPQAPGGLLLQLQRSHGNRFVQRLVGAAVAPDLLSRRGLPSLVRLAAEEQATEGQAAGEQAAEPAMRLAVGATNDRAEAAADRLADAAANNRSAAGETSVATPAGGPLIQRRATSGDPGGYLDGQTSRAIGTAQRTGGTPLRAATRARMETALGTGLSGVRVHTDTTARDLCGTVRARAFTLGQHIYFRDGLPDVGSTAGRHLLAHELAHVTQQSSPAVIRRTYLDGEGEDWVTSTTRKKLFTRRVRERPEVLRAVDDAVTGVRLAYDGGYLAMLSAALGVLSERITAWRTARQGHRRRMLDEEIDQLDQQRINLIADIRLWRDGYQTKDTKHRQQLANVQQWLADGSAPAQNVRLRNSVEWILRGRTKLFVLTETADSRYRARVRLRAQGRESTASDAAFFPIPNAAPGHGDVRDQSAGTRRYNRENAADASNVVLNTQKKGWNEQGFIALTEEGTANQGTFFQTLRHEVQHDADKFRGSELSAAMTQARQAGNGPEELYQKALREYKTEYRAHYYQGEYQDAEPGFGPLGGPTRRWGQNWGNRQLAIFEHIRGQYPTVATEVGRGTTRRQQRFIRDVHAYATADREGFNKYNSIRIDDLYHAVRLVPLHNQDAGHASMVAVLAAAANLNAQDLVYLRAGNQGTNTLEEAYMLRAMIDERLDGPAFDAFRAALPP